MSNIPALAGRSRTTIKGGGCSFSIIGSGETSDDPGADQSSEKTAKHGAKEQQDGALALNPRKIVPGSKVFKFS
jgi:hypothetical protein